MVDPIKHLSSEALTQIFSHLSTPALTRCNSVSRTWRREILVDSVLHRSMDLISLGEKVTEMELIQIVDDLARRSNFKYKELHLDLSPFWTSLATAYRLHRFEDPITFDKAMGGTGSNYALLINTIFLATKPSLESLFIVVPQGSKRPSRIPVSLSRVIIQGAMQLCGKMDSLKELHFKIPFPFGMSLGKASSEDRGDSKRFTIVQDLSGDEGVEEESLQCRKFLENAIKFTGRGLLQLEIDSSLLVGWQFEFGLDPPEVLEAQRQVQLGNFKLFLKQVKSAATFLKDLELTFDEDRVPNTALDLIVNCPNLDSLRLRLLRSRRSRGHEVKHIKFPSNASPSSIKFLELVVNHVNLDWDSEALLTWIGSSLQHLTIRNVNHHAKLQVPMSSLISILNNNPGLESITLQDVWIVQSLSSSIIPVISLPKLHSLELDVRPHLGDGMFNNLSATNLKGLQVKLRHVGRKPKLESSQEEVKDEEEDDMSDYPGQPNYDEFEGQGERQEGEADRVFNNLFHLLKACRCSVETLSIQETEDTEQWQDANIEDLQFSKLRILKLPQSSSRLDQLLSFFSFPTIQEYSNLSDYSKTPSIHSVSQVLISSSPSIESLVMGSSGRPWIHPNFSPMLSQSIIQRDIEVSNFSKLKTITLIQAALPFLSFFSQTRFEGSLETIKIQFDYENEEKKDSHFKSLFAVLDAVSSSLVTIEVKRFWSNKYATKPDRSVKTKNDFKMLEEMKKNPIEFSNLKSLLIVGCYPLLELFQLSKLPRSSVIRFGASHSFHVRPTQMSSAELENYDEEVKFRKQEMERGKRIKERNLARENQEPAEESFDEFDSDAERERDSQARHDQSRHDWI